MLFTHTIILCCLVSTAAGTGQMSLWMMAPHSLPTYTVLSIRQQINYLCCLEHFTAAVPEAELVTFNSDTGVCSAGIFTSFANISGLTTFRRCQESKQPGEELWLRMTDAINTSCWTTVQHVVSASVDFNRNWSEYRAVFGEGPGANYWAGLDTLHSLTNPTPRKLLILMKVWNNSQVWARYSSFSVGPESESFRLTVSGFSGSAGIGDSFAISNGMNFSTLDRDHTRFSGQPCSVAFRGGWWFRACFQAKLNGLHYSYPTALNTPEYAMGIIWYLPYGYYYSLQEAEMLLY